MPSAGATACGDEFAQVQRLLARPAGEREDGVVAAGARAALLRSTLREIVPGTAPERSSGTGTLAQEKPDGAVSGQGPKLEEPAEEAGQAASASAGSRAARTETWTRPWHLHRR